MDKTAGYTYRVKRDVHAVRVLHIYETRHHPECYTPALYLVNWGLLRSVSNVKCGSGMNIGDTVVLTELVLVIDDISHEFLIAGTVGTVIGTEGNLLSMQTAKGAYDGIPAASMRNKTEEKFA